MRKILLFLTILSLFSIANAQKIGDWITHTPGMTVISVDKMHETVFAATPYDIFCYNTNDNSISHLSKVSGLSDMGINIVRYSKYSDIVFVGYSNTNIDIIDNQGDVINIPDIYNKYFLGNKTINNVFFNNKYAYVCCSFGIVVIDLKRHEVYDTYIIGPNGTYLGINDLTICDNIIYAATEHGIYYAAADNPYLADFSQWSRFTNNLPTASSNFSQIETFDGYVVANFYLSDDTRRLDTLYALSGTTSWNYFLTDNQELISDLRTYDDNIIVTHESYQFKVYDKDKNLIQASENIDPNSTIFDSSNNCYWAGTQSHSLVKVYTNGKYSTIPFNGPYSNKAFSISTSGNDVWVAAGGYKSDWAPLWNNDGYSHYDGFSWDCFNSATDITCVRANPSNSGIIYAGTYNNGLLVIENNKVKKIYNNTNSTLQLNLAWLQYGQNYVFVTGMDFDSNNNLWIANSGVGKMLSVWRQDGTWQSYSIGSSDIGRLMVDAHDIKWIFKRYGELIVFNGSSVKTVNTNANTGNMPGTANCFVTDNKGTVWVGTTDGVALFTDSRKIFNNSTYQCSRILIPRNDGTGQADYLLSGQSVLSIAVDGANNLWFGTNNGVIHTSNDGQTTYHHFTMENSPLLSNTVNDIAITDDGVIYFATSKGVISYKGTATKGQETNSDVIVYPNPVRPEHNGIVGIKGLVTNALVKITTTNGVFVTHLEAEGGQAVWDCTDIYGNKVQPGIYLIFVSDESGKETFATKVLIMK